MKKLVIIWAVLSAPMFGQTLSAIQKFCEVGDQTVVTQGLNSVTHVQRSIPSCTVAVYNSGTTTLATPIYSNNLSTPTVLANPFTANVDGSFLFWANNGGCYDIVTSGGNAGDQFPAPFTYSNICPGSAGGGGSGINCAGAINGAMALWIDPGNVGCDNHAGSDFLGDVFGQSFQALGAVNGFDGLTGGLGDPLGCPQTPPTPCFGLANTFYWLAPLSVVTPFGTRPPSTIGTVGQVLVLGGQTTVNGIPVDTLTWLTPSSSATTFQTNSVNNISQALLNLIQGSGITITNGSGGNVTIAATGSGGTVTSITATAPVVATPTPITGVGVLSCPTCLTAVPSQYTYHTCTVVVGTDNGSALANADLGPQTNQCKINAAGTLSEITLSVDNASSTTSIQVRKRHCATFTAGSCTAFTLTNLLSGVLAAASTAAADACAKSSTSATCLDGTTSSSSVTISTTALGQGDWLELTSGTADATTRRATISFTWTN
jgi:hypothetical protein